MAELSRERTAPVLGILRKISDVYRPPLIGDLPSQTSLPKRDALQSSFQFGRDSVRGCSVTDFAVESRDVAEVGTAQSDGILDEGVEDWLQVECRAADDLQYLGGSGLL